MHCFSTLFFCVDMQVFLYLLMNLFINMIEKVRMKRSYGLLLLLILAISGTISFGIKIVLFY